MNAFTLNICCISKRTADPHCLILYLVHSCVDNLESVHIVVLGTWNTEIFVAITGG